MEASCDASAPVSTADAILNDLFSFLESKRKQSSSAPEPQLQELPEADKGGDDGSKKRSKKKSKKHRHDRKDKRRGSGNEKDDDDDDRHRKRRKSKRDDRSKEDACRCQKGEELIIRKQRPLSPPRPAADNGHFAARDHRGGGDRGHRREDAPFRKPADKVDPSSGVSGKGLSRDEVEEIRKKRELFKARLNKPGPEDREDGEICDDDDDGVGDGDQGSGGRRRRSSGDRRRPNRRSRSPRSRSPGPDGRRPASSSFFGRFRFGDDFRRHRGNRSRSPPPKWRRSGRLRSRSRSRSRGPDDAIDKAKLLAIARKNAVKLLSGNNLMGMDRHQLTAIKSGGQSLSQLTAFCKELAKKGLADDFSDDDDDDHRPCRPDDGDPAVGLGRAIHHPFEVKDRPLPSSLLPFSGAASSSESMNPVARLAIQSHRMTEFPVSSGNAHRDKEASVEPEDLPEGVPPSVVDPEGGGDDGEVPAEVPDATPAANPSAEAKDVKDERLDASSVPDDDRVFPKKMPEPTKDVGEIVGLRLEAMKRLSSDPNDREALSKLQLAQTEMSSWAESKYKPGQFTGHTGAKVLSKGELQLGTQAWARQDQFTNAPRVGGLSLSL